MKFVIHTMEMLPQALGFEDLICEPCYIPGRDTDQTEFGDEVLRQNLEAMKKCDDVVYVLWDGKSMGSMFDMGMAYALGKTVLPITLENNTEKAWNKFYQDKLDAGDTIRFEDKP